MKSKKSAQKFYDLGKALELLGKKMHGDNWVSENYHQITNEDYPKYIRTISTLVSLIENNFFDTIKGDGSLIQQGEEVLIFTDHPILNDYKVPEDQFDYVLEKRSRYIDKKKSEFPRVLVYNAYFGRSHGNTVVAEFNDTEINKIRDCLTIEDFGFWLKQDDLEEKDIYPILLGINPRYYNALTEIDRRTIAGKKLFPLSTTAFQYHSISDFIKDFKTLVSWQKSWDQLIKDLYDKSLILNPTFSKKCVKFLTYIKQRKLLPTSFDKYLDFARYRPNYAEYFKRQRELTKEDAAFLVMGLEPEYAKQYLKYSQIVGDAGGFYNSLQDDEKIFFYKSYDNFVNENCIFIGNNSLIQGHSSYGGDLEEFISDLYNKGFLFDDFLLNSLTKLKKKLPAYHKNSNLYRTLQFFSQMKYWRFEDVYKLMTGKNPINDEELFSFLGREKINEYNIHQFKDNEPYRVLLKAEYYCKMDRIEQFYEKVGEGFAPQDFLEWLIKYSNVSIMEPLLKLTFHNKPKKLAELKKLSQNAESKKSKTGRPLKINYSRIWVIFITDILEGSFDDNNSNHAQQAKGAFEQLAEEKQNKLRKLAKTNFSQGILAKCEKEMEASIGSITANIVEPFLAEFSEEFFQ